MNIGCLAIETIFKRVSIFQYSSGNYGNLTQINAMVISSLLGKKFGDHDLMEITCPPIIQGLFARIESLIFSDEKQNK